jgi:2-oxo-4-hydroxy-4-carboxy-5-ureidoimidazoline decarboxylase
VLSIDELNSLDLDDFVTALGHVFESTPSLAVVAWRERPFADRAAVVRAFMAAADDLDEEGVLVLLRSHPELAATGPLTIESTDEQRSAGLSDLDDEMRSRIRRANDRYQDRFGFPFIVAVRGLGPAEIALALAERLGHDEVQERAIALAQVKRIAELRIGHVVGP